MDEEVRTLLLCFLCLPSLALVVSSSNLQAGRVLDCTPGGGDLADVQHTISDAQLAAIEGWHAHDAAQHGFCDVDGDSSFSRARP